MCLVCVCVVCVCLGVNWWDVYTHLYRLTFPEHKLPQKRKLDKPTSKQEEVEGVEDDTLVVEPYTIPNRGPYPYNQPKK